MSEPSSAPASPWLTVWLQPVQTMQRLLTTPQEDMWATPLLVAGGILSAISPQMQSELLSRFPELNAQNIQAASLILGLLSGLLQAALWPLLLHWGARLVGSATTTIRPARLAAAWSSLPVLLGYLLSPLIFKLLEVNDTAGALGTLNILFSIWSLVLLSHMLGAGYGLDSGRGALGVLLAGIFGFAGVFALACVVIVLSLSIK